MTHGGVRGGSSQPIRSKYFSAQPITGEETVNPPPLRFFPPKGGTPFQFKKSSSFLVVEEGILEDLCEIAGEEAEIGGEIMLGDDKSDLLKRISKNTATKDIFKSQDSYQSFVNNKIAGSGSSTLDLATSTKESVTR